MTATNNICVDFDGVIAEDSGWKGPEHFGKPIEGAREFLTALQRNGYRIVIFTMRCSPAMFPGRTVHELVQLVGKWMFDNQMPYDEIYTGVGKPYCQAFVDDRAIYCDPLFDALHKSDHKLGHAECRRLYWDSILEKVRRAKPTV